MCGILGISNWVAEDFSSEFEKILDLLSHRGPNESNMWVDSNVNLALGHRRLSIIDLSDSGKQPMSSKNQRYIIVYNGELYNFKEILSELQKDYPNLELRGNSDTEVLLEAISAWGLQKTLKKANGMFAFGLWDKKNKKLSLARDRFGKKPIYFGWSNNRFVFSSELKSIIALPNFTNEISPSSLNHYFKYKNIPTPYSIFENIYKLPSGSFIDFEYSELSKSLSINQVQQKAISFWNIGDVLKQNNKNKNRENGTPKQKFRQLLKDSVDKRMISDVPLGAFLSGGIDSSLVVSIMQEISSKPVKTFTIGFSDEEYDEASTARLIAETLGTEHTEHYIKEKDAYSIVPNLASIYDEPFADASQIPTILVSKLAKEDVTVALTGDGGDELMGGYSRHLFANKLWKLNKKIPNVMKGLVPVKFISNSEFAIQYLYNKLSNASLVSKNYRQFGNKVVKATSSLIAENEEEFYSSLLKNKINGQELFSKLLEGYKSKDNIFNFSVTISDLSMKERIMFWDVKNYMMDNVLVKVDRATMSTSLEARSPLLDYRLFEYIWSLPAEKIVNRRDGGKLLMKSLLRDYLPEEVLKKPKSGFRIPIGKWLKGPLKEWAESLIYSNNGSYEYISKDYVQELWVKHLNDQGNWEDEIWTILMFQSWYNHYIRAKE